MPPDRGLGVKFWIFRTTLYWSKTRLFMWLKSDLNCTNATIIWGSVPKKRFKDSKGCSIRNERLFPLPLPFIPFIPVLGNCSRVGSMLFLRRSHSLALLAFQSCKDPLHGHPRRLLAVCQKGTSWSRRLFANLCFSFDACADLCCWAEADPRPSLLWSDNDSVRRRTGLLSATTKWILVYSAVIYKENGESDRA